MNQNYYPIKPIKAFIKAEQILKNNPFSDYIKCDVIGLCFYEKEALTFLVKLNDGEIFRYIPSTALFLNKEFRPFQYELSDLIYHDNPSDNVKISYIETLKGSSSAYLVSKNQWIECEYILSIDFYKDEKMLHLVKLMNGQIAALPFHKLKFKPIDKIEYSFKQFKKQNLKYRVGGLE